MAKKKEQRIVWGKKTAFDALKEEAGGDKIIQHYKNQQANGGGTPIAEPGASPKGYDDGGIGRGAMKTISKAEEATKERQKNQQPRDDEGHFTYNSAAGKGLSKTSDPNRGHTVNPILTGGKPYYKKDKDGKVMTDASGKPIMGTMADFVKEIRDPNSELAKKFSKIALIEGGEYVYRGEVWKVNRVTVLDELLSMYGKTSRSDTGKNVADVRYKRDEGGVVIDKETGKKTRQTVQYVENANKEKIIDSVRHFRSYGQMTIDGKGVDVYAIATKIGKPTTRKQKQAISGKGGIANKNYTQFRNVETNAADFISKKEERQRGEPNITEERAEKLKIDKAKIGGFFKKYKEEQAALKEKKEKKEKDKIKRKRSGDIREKLKDSGTAAESNYRQMIEKYEQEKLKNKSDKNEQKLEDIDWSDLE